MEGLQWGKFVDFRPGSGTCGAYGVWGLGFGVYSFASLNRVEAVSFERRLMYSLGSADAISIAFVTSVSVTWQDCQPIRKVVARYSLLVPEVTDMQVLC